ncbi:MAG: NAD-dependent epimerase/dehydratase family protein [Myxococcales bacterium]|nr:MAG: NAD-dependent epimerase/dehydratase family protein [Myxococcales bacterium]
MTSSSPQQTALVLGATGGIGGSVARVLVARGWKVRALHRDPARVAGSIEGVEWVSGDSMQPATVLAAARGVDVIVHAVNPPGYHNWAGLVLPMLDSTIAAARATGARIVFPGTVYNYGPDAFPRLTEESPEHPTTRKGAIRVEMERRLRAASQDGVRTLIVRAGDFFGPGPGNTWLAQIVAPGKPVTKVVYPGLPDVGHAWAYLPDLAETMVRLLERGDELAAFEAFHFGGHWFDRGIAFAEGVRRAAGRPDLPIKPFAWWLTWLTAPFVEVMREVREMRYLWETSLQLDNRKLVAFLGSEPHTPLDEALRVSLRASKNLV